MRGRISSARNARSRSSPCWWVSTSCSPGVGMRRSGSADEDAMVAAAKAPKIRGDFGLNVRLERDESNDQRSVAGQPFHGLVRIRLTGKSLAQQSQEQAKGRRIESAQLGKPGLVVGGQ